MSAPVDVLAVMEQAACALRIDARYGQGADMDAAYAAVVELIAADTEYDAAHSAWVSGPYVTHAQYERLQAAKVRRAGALARVKGEGQ